MKKVLCLVGFIGIACVCYCVISNTSPVKAPPRQIAPDDGVAPRWEKPQTTRRYLHGPLSERLLTFWREGKLVFAEWGVEERRGMLYGKIDCYLTEALTPEENS